MALRAVSTVAAAAFTAACAGAVARTPPDVPARPRIAIAQLWVDPGPTPRDLFWGSGGRAGAPDPDAVYTLESRDDSGFSVSYDVIGPRGTEWSAKIGPEAQTEVVVSRILWGVGYHQPPVYYLPSWTIADGRGGRRRESEARFRPKLDHMKPADEYWSWADNPFVGERELRGLLVILLMVNSTDLKDDNNSIYELSAPREGASRWYLVRDLGAALGETGKLYPRRNWLEGFERSRFITGVDGNAVTFDYGGRHEKLLSFVTPGDVRWAAARMNRLTDAQWRDAFRAGNYGEPAASRYIARIKARIAQGLALPAGQGPPAR
jgi:hypothetical protein